MFSTTYNLQHFNIHIQLWKVTLVVHYSSIVLKIQHIVKRFDSDAATALSLSLCIVSHNVPPTALIDYMSRLTSILLSSAPH